LGDNGEAKASSTLFESENITALSQLRSTIALIAKHMAQASAEKTEDSAGSL